MIERLGAIGRGSSLRRGNKKPKSYRPENEFPPKLAGIDRNAWNKPKWGEI